MRQKSITKARKHENTRMGTIVPLCRSRRVLTTELKPLGRSRDQVMQAVFLK
jgi:hypothetical protein